MSATQVDTAAVSRDAKQYFLPHYPALPPLQMRPIPHSYYDFVAPNYYQQQNAFKHDQELSAPAQPPLYASDQRNHGLRRPISKNKISYNDEEAFEMASAIVNTYLSLKESGAGPTNPVMDIYVGNSGETQQF